MSRFLRPAAATLLAVAATAAIVALSRMPYAVRGSDEAMVRLSWSGRPARIERCRELSDSELAKLPAHMRQREECEGRSAHYLVRVLDGPVTLSTDTVTGGGLRGDRSIHMLREYRVSPGLHAIAVEVARTDTTADAEPVEGEEPDTEPSGAEPLDRSAREREERRRQREERLPPRLRYDTTLRLTAGSVLLVMYDPVERRLLGVTGERAR